MLFFSFFFKRIRNWIEFLLLLSLKQTLTQIYLYFICSVITFTPIELIILITNKYHIRENGRETKPNQPKNKNIPCATSPLLRHYFFSHHNFYTTIKQRETKLRNNQIKMNEKKQNNINMYLCEPLLAFKSNLNPWINVNNSQKEIKIAAHFYSISPIHPKNRRINEKISFPNPNRMELIMRWDERWKMVQPH